MSRTSTVSLGLKVAIVLVYGLLIPLLLVGPVSARKWRENGVWINLVRNDRLRMFDQTRYDSEFSYGKNRWNDANKVLVTWNNNNYEVVIYDARNCAWDFMAQTYPRGFIETNRCLMDWNGGYYPGYGATIGATPVNRRYRTGSHEIGHALGFGHPNYDGQPCRSVMSEVLSYRNPTCYGPTPDDLNELRGWNY